MMNKKYWDLTDRPHTERKLQIIKEYIYPWATIIFGQWKRYHYKNFRVAYYIDCFAGRGKYHKNNIQDSVNGSPLIALEFAKLFKEKYNGEVQLKCIFVENNKKYCSDLDNFCKPFKNIIEFKIIPGDFNSKIKDILEEIGTNAALFFIDPGELRDLKKETIKKIVNKKGPKDIIVNYICGTKRVLASIKKSVSDVNVVLPLKINKTIKTIADFHGLDILKFFDKSEVSILKNWTEEIIKDTNLQWKIVYPMISSFKKETVYYLFFASRAQVAKKIMKDIFTKKDSTDYSGQKKLFCLNDFDI